MTVHLDKNIINEIRDKLERLNTINRKQRRRLKKSIVTFLYSYYKIAQKTRRETENNDKQNNINDNIKKIDAKKFIEYLFKD